MLKFEINRMNSFFFFYLRRTEKSDFEKNEFKVLGMYILARSWGRPTARYMLKQALEPEILWISLQKFNSMFLKNYTFKISKKKKKIDFLKILDHHLPLKKNFRSTIKLRAASRFCPGKNTRFTLLRAATIFVRFFFKGTFTF